MKKLVIKFLVILLCSLCLSVSCSAASASNETSIGYKTIPIEQWELLKQNQQMLELKLYELNEQVEKLEKPSKTLLMELEEARSRLQQSQMALRELNVQLKNVESLLTETRKLLSELTAQVEAERNKQKAIVQKHKIQKVFWFLIGTAIGAQFK